MTASNRARDSRPPSPYFGLSRNPSVQRAGNVQIMQASQVSKIPANLPLRLHIICVSPIQNDPKSLKSSSFSPQKILIFLKITSQRHPKTMFPIFLEYPKSSTFRTPPVLVAPGGLSGRDFWGRHIIRGSWDPWYPDGPPRQAQWLITNCQWIHVWYIYGIYIC